MVDLASLQHKDSLTRQSNLGEFLSSLQKNTIPLADINSDDKYELISIFVENIKSSNPRLALPSLECLQALSDTCLNGEINILNKNIISACREKLSDTHDNVRQSACNLLLTMMSPSLGIGPQEVLQQLIELTLKHKSPKVREEGLKLIKTSLNMYPNDLKISRFIQLIFSMLSDSMAPVRNAANDLLVLSYIKFGDRIKTDLLKSQIPDDKIKRLLKDFQNMDAQKSSVHEILPNSDYKLQEDYSVLKPMISIEGQPLAFVEYISNSSVDSEEGSAKSMPILSKLPTIQKRIGGGLTVEDFERAFAEVDDVFINTESDLEKQIVKLIAGLQVDSEEWEMRVSTLKEFQGTVKTCTNKFASFPHHLRKLDGPINDCLRDLRSQVAREACITLAYTSKLNGKSMDKSFEYLITPLLTVIQNSTKIINSSADICLQYCLLNTQTSKVVPLICRQMESKAAIVKKRCAEYLLIMLQNWAMPQLKQHESAICDSIKKGLIDGDPNCREFSRTCFPYYNRHFPASGNKLLAALTPALQKTLRDMTPESELTQNVCSISKGRSTIPRPGSRPNSRQGTPVLGLRSTVSETNLRETEPRSQSREESRPPKHTLDVPSRANTMSGTKPKIRTSLGGIRCSSAMSVEKEEPETNRSRPISGSTIRKKTSNNTVPHSEGTSVNQRKIQSLIKLKTRTKDSSPETGYGDKKSSAETSNRRSQSADYLSRTKNSQTTSPELIPLEKLNLPDLVKQIKRQHFADKKAGIEGLRQLVNSVEYTFSQEEVQLFKDSLRWLFPESHAKLFIMFLELLISFIQVYKSYAEQWAHFILMKLLHRLGTETMSTVRDKIVKVLDVIMLNFQKERIFACLWRILTDTTQPLNLKGKQAYCDFLKTITNHADGPDFNVSQESTKAFESLVRMAQDPKPELSRYSKATLQSLFQLNPATFSSLADTMPRGDRELLTSLMRDATETPPTEQEEFSPNSNLALDQLLRGYGSEDRRISEPFLIIPPKLKPSESELRRVCLTPVLGGKKYDSVKTVRGISKFNRGAISPLDSRQKFGSGIRSEPASPTDDTLLPSFSLPPSQLRNLMLKDPTVEPNFEAYDYEEYPIRNPIQSAIKEYNLCESIEDKVSNLILILTIIQTSQDDSWIDQMDVILGLAMEAMRQYEYPTITITSLRIIREFLKRRLVQLKDHTKELVQFLVDTYPNPKSDIARSCEEIMNHIAGNIDPDVTFEMLAPTISIEQNESLVSAIGKHKILHKIVPDTSHAILNAHLATFCPALILNYKHADPAVRKASCFVLVVLYRKLGMSVYEYFKELTSAQMKLLTLYMSRSTDEMK